MNILKRVGSLRARRGLLDRALVVTALTLALSGAARVASAPAEASNLTWDARHLGRMHTAAWDEDFCVETTNTTRSWSTIQSNIEKALWIEAPSADRKWDAKGWDPGMSHYKVWFWAHWGNPCQLLPPSERDPITIEYRMYDNNTPNCGAQKCSVAIAYVPWNPDPKGHAAHVYYLIYLYAPYTAGEEIQFYYRHQVNHETGHALGFDHGSGCGSVMHEAGCVHEQFPTTSDTASELTRIDN